MTNYKFINPHIEGEFKNLFSGNTAVDAAMNAWDSLSKYFKNNVPKFAFTLEKVNDGSLHHFVVKEKMNGGGSDVDYELKEITVKLTKDDCVNLRNRVNAVSKNIQNGGKSHRLHNLHRANKHDDSSTSSESSSTSSDSSTDVFSRIKMQRSVMRNLPIVYWWYNPLIYGFENFYLPTFTSAINPYVEIELFNYYPMLGPTISYI